MRFPILFGAVILLASCASGKQARPASGTVEELGQMKRDASAETIKAESSGDIGYEIGVFTLTMNGPDGTPVQEQGRYIELLKRGADGKWYSTAGIWNPAPPAAP